MDALDWLEEGKDLKASKSDVTNFTKSILSCEVGTHAAVGLGMDCRFESLKMIGFALALDGKMVHISIFARDAAERGGESRSSRMANTAE